MGVWPDVGSARNGWSYNHSVRCATCYLSAARFRDLNVADGHGSRDHGFTSTLTVK